MKVKQREVAHIEVNKKAPILFCTLSSVCKKQFSAYHLHHLHSHNPFNVIMIFGGPVDYLFFNESEILHFDKTGFDESVCNRINNFLIQIQLEIVFLRHCGKGQKG